MFESLKRTHEQVVNPKQFRVGDIPGGFGKMWSDFRGTKKTSLNFITGS